MARPRLYIDEDSMSHALVRALRARGIDVVTALDEDMVERSDADHLAYATSLGRVMFTYNVGDFLRLHDEVLAAGEHHSGLMLAAQQRYTVGELMRRIVRLFGAVSAADMVDRVEFLNRWPGGSP